MNMSQVSRESDNKIDASYSHPFLLFTVLSIFTSPAYAHGGADFIAMMVFIWGFIPLIVISLVVLPLTLLIGKQFQLKRKRSITVGIVVTILIYPLYLQNIRSISRWVVDLQYYFD